MKMPDNTLISVKEYYFNELKEIVDTREIDQLYSLAVNHYLGWEKYELRIRENERLSESEMLRFIYCVKDLKKNKPIQYILGKTSFYGLDFHVDENVLIPRPETEELVDWIITHCKSLNSFPRRIIDIGTGSGCIAISLKKNLPNVEVWAMDVSNGAIGIAEKNAELNNVEINFAKADVLQLPNLSKQFDLIISNPPYIAHSEAKLMHENVLGYEPHLALFVDHDDVLLFYKKIVEWAKLYGSPEAEVFFEINENNGADLSAYYTQLRYSCELRKDLSNKDRMMRITL